MLSSISFALFVVLLCAEVARRERNIESIFHDRIKLFARSHTSPANRLAWIGVKQRFLSPLFHFFPPVALFEPFSHSRPGTQFTWG